MAVISFFRQWAAVLRADGKRFTFGMILLMAKNFVVYLPRLILHPKEFYGQYRSRLRRCAKCPVYDPVLCRCGPENEPTIGCRCFLKVAALPCFKKHGWLQEQNLPGASEFCW